MRVYFILLIQLCFVATGVTQNNQEFTGPYPSWADVKKRFGAWGDGKHDDTKALQMALDSLTVQPTGFNTGRRAYTVLYLPAGTYRISSTLKLAGKIGISIIGEDPANTIIKWFGPEKDTMFWANGSAYYKISRLSFHANDINYVECIGIFWKNRWNHGGSQSFASLNIEVSDCIFTGRCFRGITAGTYNDTGTGMNDSEVTIQRCLFDKCRNAGINIKGFNALDYWIWDCRFIDCTAGGIQLYHGNYHVYRSYFEKSGHMDILNDNGYYTSVRNCFSTRSRGFSFDAGASCNPFKRTFQSNFVSQTTLLNIHYYHLGKLTLFDNVIQKGSNKQDTSVVTYQSWCNGNYQVLSVNNRFESVSPYKIAMAKKEVFSIKDARTYDRRSASTATSFFATQQTTPKKIQRTVFDVPANASSAIIQAIINKAAALRGGRPVVHFPYGTFSLSAPLQIPAKSDMQIVGDGYINATVLTKAPGFPAGRPLIQIDGPSYITLSDLQVGDNTQKTASDAIVVSGVDQPSAQVFVDQLYALSDNAIHLDGMDYLYVQKDNSFFSYGNKVTGGKLMQQGKGTAGLYCYGGQYGKLSVQNNGNFVAKDCWWEGNDRVPLNLEGSGNITIDGFMLAPVNVDSNVSVNIGAFNGKVTIMNGYLQGAINVNGNNPNLDVFLWNIHFYHKMNPLQFTRQKANYRGLFAGLSSQCFTAKAECKDIQSVDDKNVNVANQKQFIENMVAQDRAATPRKFTKLPGAASNIFMTRVAIGQCNTGIRFVK